MIVKVAKLFELAGLVMAGTRLITKKPKDPQIIAVPGYDKVHHLGIVAFRAYGITGSGWTGESFTAAEIAESRTLVCPHCHNEYPEQCDCPPDRNCQCFSCRKVDFEPARDRGAENARERETDDLSFLSLRLGPQYQDVIDACDGDVVEAATATRWFLTPQVQSVGAEKLAILAEMAGYEKFSLAHLTLVANSFRLPPLLDPMGRPPKKRHQMARMLIAAIEAARIVNKNRAKQ